MLPTGRHHRYDWLLKDTTTPLELPVLTKTKLRLIETADFLSAPDKRELLGLMLCLWFTGELKIKMNKQIAELLDKLGLSWFENSYIHSKKGLIKWIQVSANAQINQFIKKYGRTMSPMEAGLLYNYPAVDILAFMHLVSSKNQHPRTLVGHYFGKVHSKDLYDKVYREYRTRWRLLKQTSSIIYRELTQHYKSKSRRQTPQPRAG